MRLALRRPGIRGMAVASLSLLGVAVFAKGLEASGCALLSSRLTSIPEIRTLLSLRWITT